jgi:DNA-binding transcriptional ArsR family regulator
MWYGDKNAMSSQATRASRESRLDAVFSALSDATRRSMLARLAQGEATITELGEPFDMTLPAVSKHLRVLERAGLVRRKRRGWYHHCYLEARPLGEALAFLGRYRPFWESTLEELARYVEGPSQKESGR